MWPFWLIGTCLPEGTPSCQTAHGWRKACRALHYSLSAFGCYQDLVEMSGMGGGVGSSCTRMELHWAACSLAGPRPWAGGS